MLKQNAFKAVLLCMSIIFLLLIPVQLPEKVGAIDFRPYWSSSFLLAKGQDFSNPENLDMVERIQTGWTEPYTMYAWFAPTGNLILLPYTFIPFSQATYYWLLTNILILFSCALLVWRDKSRIWIALVAMFIFEPTLVSMMFGQVNTLVFLGLALFLIFNRKQDWTMGASLILTTVKAHLVILTLPLLLFNMIRYKRWQALAGFTGMLFLCVVILFILYPAWHISFLKLLNLGLSDFRTTPTLSGLLTILGKSDYGKLIWVVGLFISLIFYWRYGKTWDIRTMIDVSLLIGIIISPVGWSYDYIMLLFPILSILEWVTSGLILRKNARVIVTILLFVNIIIYYQRVLGVNEVWFFWVPPTLTVLYVFSKTKIQVPSPPFSPN